MNTPLARLPRLLAGAACALAALASLAAFAHVSLETPQAPAGSGYKAVFRVSHGCEGSPTNEFIIDMPPGVQGAKPMPKPGWRVDIERRPLAEPYTRHGRSVREEVARVRWSGGSLAHEHYDEFVLQLRLPETAGALYWKVSQVCERGRLDWHELPAEGGAAGKPPEHPAVKLQVVPATRGGGHAH